MKTSNERYDQIQRWRSRNPDKPAEYNRRWRAKNLEKSALIGRKYYFRTKFGLTLDDLNVMADAQGGKCLICETDPKELVVDHDHETGEIRGMLCRNCNSRLGWFESKRERIVKYMDRDV